MTRSRRMTILRSDLMVRWKFNFSVEPTSYSSVKKIVDGKIKQFYWNLTQLCSQNCIQCYAHTNKDTEFSTEEAIQAVDKIAESGAGLLTFCGGEPLEREDFFEIAIHANNKGLKLSLISNGLKVRENIDRIKKAGISRIQISLDGSNGDLHDSIRRRKGSFQKTIDSIKTSVDAGIRTSVCTTILKQNFKDIPSIFELSNNIGAHEYRLMRLMPAGKGGKDYADLSIGKMEYFNLLKTLLENNLTTSSVKVIDVEEPISFVKELEKQNVKNTEKIYYRSCLQGEAVCALSPRGEILPCPIGNFREFESGNILKSSINEIWKDTIAFNYFRDINKIDACNQCEYGKECGGGCRCAALGYYGDIKAPDPFCLWVDTDGKKYSRQL